MRTKRMLHTKEVKRMCLRRISRWRGCSSSALSEANGGASAGGAALYPHRASTEVPRRLATQAGKQLRALTHAHGAVRAAAALDRGAVIPIGSL